MDKVRMARWVEDTTGTLLRAGHRLTDIQEYTFLQFMAFAKIEERQEATRRLNFVTDVSAVLAGMMGDGKGKGKKRKESPLSTHIQSLMDSYYEE